MLSQVRIIIAIHHAGLRELAHILCSINEEDRIILKNEILCLTVAEQFFAIHAKQLDPNAAGAKQVRCGRRGITGESHPGFKTSLVSIEYANPVLFWQVLLDFEIPLDHSVQFSKDGSSSRGFALPDVVRLRYPD